MKKITVVFAVIVIILASCTKQAPMDIGAKEMNYEQLSKEIGKAIAFKIFDNAGLTEADPMARGKKVKAEATISVLFDIGLTVSATGDIEYTTTPDAQWGGVTKFLSQTSNDGALGIWDCNRYFVTAPPPIVHCHDGATAGYSLRAFTSDHDYTVHLSGWVSVP